MARLCRAGHNIYNKLPNEYKPEFINKKIITDLFNKSDLKQNPPSKLKKITIIKPIKKNVNHCQNQNENQNQNQNQYQNQYQKLYRYQKQLSQSTTLLICAIMQKIVVLQT
jgi:hypothetical protein